VCGLAASVIAMVLGLVFSGEMHWDHLSLVVASSILTASMVSLVLGSTMVSVILLSKRFNVNPDNIATPVAGSLGDVVTLGMLSCIARFLFDEMNGMKHNDLHVNHKFTIIASREYIAINCIAWAEDNHAIYHLFLHFNLDGRLWLPYIIISVYAVILPICLVITWKNEFTKPVVMYGWVPLIVSVAIST